MKKIILLVLAVFVMVGNHDASRGSTLRESLYQDTIYPISYFPGNIYLITPVSKNGCMYNQENVQHYSYGFRLYIQEVMSLSSFGRPITPSPFWFLNNQMDIELWVNDELAVDIKGHFFENMEHIRDEEYSALSICLGDFEQQAYAFRLHFIKPSEVEYSYTFDYHFRPAPTQQELEDFLGTPIPDTLQMANLSRYYSFDLVSSQIDKEGFIAKLVASSGELNATINAIAGKTINMGEMETPFDLPDSQIGLSWWAIGEATQLDFGGVFQSDPDYDIRHYVFFVDKSSSNLILYLIVYGMIYPPKN
ncbi:MAG: hypothetical protein F9K27_17390 [Anaerolineae bacterium]|nr:MAG: hypothetical protein F9K27_17390 [Anaerolineae bacterium]